jgi:hypothetical protein
MYPCPANAAHGRDHLRSGAGEPDRRQLRWHCRVRKVGLDGFHRLSPWSERVAQPVEHVTFNHGVLGSSPSALTNYPTKPVDWLARLRTVTADTDSPLPNLDR